MPCTKPTTTAILTKLKMMNFQSILDLHRYAGVEVEMHDKVAALEKLGRATGLFNITDPDAAAPPLMGGDVGKTVTFFIPDNGTGPKMIDVTPSKPGK